MPGSVRWAAGALFALTAAVAVTSESFAVDLDENEIKAAFVLNLIRLVEWPDLGPSASDFNIGLLGESPLEALLVANVNGRTVGRRPIVTKSFASTDMPGWQECELLIIGVSMTSELPEILRGVSDTTLTVSELPGFVTLGGDVALYKRGRRIRLEIPRALIDSSRLKVSSKLLRVATISE